MDWMKELGGVLDRYAPGNAGPPEATAVHEDFDRFAQLHVIASVQPYHAIDDGRWAERRIGHDRASRTYAFRTFLDHGVRLAFGTDWSVAPLNPMLSVYAAVTRATLDGSSPRCSASRPERTP